MQPLPLTNGALFISASFLERLETCPRSAQYYKLDARISIDNAGGLNFGKHIHTAMELYNLHTGMGTDPSQIDSLVADQLTKDFGAHAPVDGDHRDLNWAIETYQRYKRQFEFDSFSLLEYAQPLECKACKDHPTDPCNFCLGTRQRKVMVEVPFAVKLFDYVNDKSNLFPVELPIYYHGYIDLPIKINNQLFVLDYKTSSVLGNGFWDAQRMSAQQKGYCWAMRETTKLDVAGHIVRAIRTSKMPATVAQGKPNRNTGNVTSIENWWAEGFPEEKFYLGTNELEEWKTNAISLVEEFLWHYSRSYFPKKTQWCCGKYGKCQYYEVCSVFPETDRSLILNSGLFKTKEQTNI
jgi:hypothetical protein